MFSKDYEKVITIFTHFLFKYPSISVALQCTLDELENSDEIEIKEELSECLDKINAGVPETEVLSDYAEKTGIAEWKDIADKVKEGELQKKDIGFFVKGVNMEEYYKEKNEQWRAKRYNKYRK